MVVKSVTILGSTGSIGISTLNVIEQHTDKYKVFALTANTNIEQLSEQCVRYKPRYAVMADEDSASKLRLSLSNLAPDIEIFSGVEGLTNVASHIDTDYVMAAIVGAAGLLPTLAAAHAGKRVLLANKESLVMSGKLFMDAVHQNGAELLPIDSEHNALFQCMPSDFHNGLDQIGVTRILITASGGPFRETALHELEQVTPKQACDHPNWDMGKKISVDSATMMNKGFELIEAFWLFDINYERIDIVLHPQSIIHSMVEFIDGSIKSQMGNPDMKIPIQFALTYPKRLNSDLEKFDFTSLSDLTFEAPSMEKYPSIKLAYSALKKAGTSCAAINLSNDIAVELFLMNKISFNEIYELNNKVFELHKWLKNPSISDIVELEKWINDFYKTLIK